MIIKLGVAKSKNAIERFALAWSTRTRINTNLQAVLIENKSGQRCASVILCVLFFEQNSVPALGPGVVFSKENPMTG